MDKKIAIIGAGSSGLFLAKKLSQFRSFQIHIFEKGKNVGAKLRASGGGKANIFNKTVTPSCYNDPAFMERVLKVVSPDVLKETLELWGLCMISDEEGRVYPYSQFSQTMVDILCEPAAKNVNLHLENEVKSLKHNGDGWVINDYPVPFDVVVLATGTPANMTLSNQLNYNQFLKPLHLREYAYEPSLVGFKLKNYPKSLAGCRVKVVASLYQKDHLIHQEVGEVTFKEDGVSGIVILNLSAYYNRLAQKQQCSISLNFMYAGAYDVQKHLKKFGSLKGILHPKLCKLYEQAPFDVCNFNMEIDQTYDIAFAQVCHGGIDTQEVDDHLALKRFSNVYVMGEMLNVDGLCGGYNLFFAFASAIIVAQNIQSAYL